MGIAERTDSASVPISSACGCTHPTAFLHTPIDASNFVRDYQPGPWREFRAGDERRLPDLPFPAEFRVDEAERVQFLHVFPELRVGPRLLAVLLAHDRVGLFRLPHRH